MEKASRKPKNDRLSLLPDDVICHILCFLPTRISDMNYVKQMRYSDMVSSVMSQRQAQTINTFRLRFSYVNDVRSSELKAWIENAISCNVGCVDLSLPYMHPTPRKLFTCETLVSLKLDSCFIGGGTVSLPNLKKLHLYYVSCEDDKTNLFFRSYWGATNNDLKIWTETFEGWPACLCSLGSVTFDKFGCREAEFEMVRYLMRNAKVLKRMKIVFYRENVCAEKRYDAMKRILSLEKGQGV